MNYLHQLIRVLLWHRRSAARIRREQSRLLRETITRAHAEVPFYTKLYNDAGIRPETIADVDGIRRLPIVARLQYRKAPESERLSVGADTSTTRKLKTSGSTGIPLVMHFSRRDYDFFTSSWDAARIRWGLWPWRSRLSIGNNRRDRTAPRHDAVEMDGDFRRVFEKHYDIIAGYPSVLFLLARESQRTARQLNPRIVYSGGETLLPAMRAFLEKTFRVPVIDFYGTIEFGIVLEPCPAGNGFRQLAPWWIVEVIKPDGSAAAPGEQGELIITSLTSRTMPLIRYAIGDFAVAGPTRCACGSGYTHIAQIIGRSTDMVYHTDGTEIIPMIISIPFYERTDILHYRVTQRSRSSFFIEIVSTQDSPFDHLAEEVRAFYTTRFGATEVEIKQVSTIPPEPSGKTRRFIPLRETADSFPAH